jgi:hypothetical protein
MVSSNALMILRYSLDLLWMRYPISAGSGEDQKTQSSLLRKPRCITITLPQITTELLVQRSIREEFSG